MKYCKTNGSFLGRNEREEHPLQSDQNSPIHFISKNANHQWYNISSEKLQCWLFSMDPLPTSIFQLSLTYSILQKVASLHCFSKLLYHFDFYLGSAKDWHWQEIGVWKKTIEMHPFLTFPIQCRSSGRSYVPP